MIQVQTKLVVLKWNGAMIFEIRKPRHVVKKKKKKKKKIPYLHVLKYLYHVPIL